ncbi:MAG: hypothetical protein H6619_05185 [Deltaproteobacteria bacterium]|nr:hypothetical protein [Deltaproteobacteria bacterium]
MPKRSTSGALNFCYAKPRTKGKKGYDGKTKVSYTCGDAADKSRAISEILSGLGLTIGSICESHCSSGCLADDFWSEHGDGINLSHHNGPDECYYTIVGTGRGNVWTTDCDCPN